MAKRATVYDVAQRAGVSIATVSFTFSQPQRVKESTRQTVLAAAAALGYVPSGSARGLASGRTGAIGLYSYDYLLDGEVAGRGEPEDLVVGADRSWFFPLYVDEVQNGVELECRARGYALLLSGERATPDTRPIPDVAGRVDALITFAGTVPDPALQRLSERIPVLEFSHDVRVDRVHTVTADNHDGMYRLTEHLIEEHGLRTLVFAGHLAAGEARARYEGHTAALADHGLTARPALPSRPGAAGSTVRAVRALLDAGPLPDALMCATDQEAVLALSILRSAGVAVPDDIAVTGFDGILAGRLSTPTLTTVRQPMEELGRTAVRTVIEALQNWEAQPSTRPQRLRLPVELVRRASCGCP
ncbi:LacI family DNA-binding transcriptional regulator [Streptomyces sp. CA-111067]|uniref:LacI family DNA-binding transcriptional regulator n=1 Tax=Streptomyces sp. CA-111067 TaxID=3240046 RepID=UPI003D961AFF